MRAEFKLLSVSQALKGEPSSSVFSTDGTLISASAAPHCRVKTGDMEILSGHWHKKMAPEHINQLNSSTPPTLCVCGGGVGGAVGRYKILQCVFHKTWLFWGTFT